MLFAVRVDIDVYDASGNVVHIAGKSEFPMLRTKRQYKHRNGDDCVTSIFSDASKIGTVLVWIIKRGGACQSKIACVAFLSCMNFYANGRFYKMLFSSMQN
ncbi:hypothetical protein AVEN_226218-1 [Araneus ventricosus]|uniref:Uncharacterized protein n=1 Tax=Araneus ventricosus TaxID=182803 RepID=A0A4Y2K0L3_ARAVE|nr:hypothetical protein AVEN_226218-1 [Araneus ventricosus]